MMMFCAFCNLELSNVFIPNKLPNCSHVICVRCSDDLNSQNVQGPSFCPICKAPINKPTENYPSSNTPFGSEHSQFLTGDSNNQFGTENFQFRTGDRNNQFSTENSQFRTGDRNNQFGTENSQFRTGDRNNKFATERSPFFTGDSNNKLGAENSQFMTVDRKNQFGTERSPFSAGNRNITFGTERSSFFTGDSNNKFSTEHSHFATGDTNNKFGSEHSHFVTGDSNNKFGTEHSQFVTGDSNNKFGIEHSQFVTDDSNNKFGTEHSQFVTDDSTWPRAHIIGHNWLVKLRDQSKLCKELKVNFSYQLLPDKAFDEVIQIAKNGDLQHHQNLILFACIPLAWRVHRPQNFANLTLFLPNLAFDSNLFKSYITDLMDALCHHRSDTNLFVFSPPLLDVDLFNKMRIDYAGLEFRDVVQACPQIQSNAVLNHARFYMKELHPVNYKKLPHNVHIIYGHNISLIVNPKVRSCIMDYIHRKTQKLQLDDLYVNGVDPTNEFVSEIYKELAEILKKNAAKPITPVKDNLPRSGDIPVSNIEIFSINCKENSINNTKNLPVHDPKHIMDATSEEMLRAAEYLKTIRDTCYPSVTNRELADVAIDSIKKFFS